jgi:hypothetical protein
MSERDETLNRWRQGEERLYPIVMVRPDLYEKSAVLVRSLADSLEGVPDMDALVASYRVGDAPGDFARAEIDPDDVPSEIDRDLVRDAAYNHRARALAMRAPVEEAERLIARAHAAGDPTAILWSQGENEREPGYRRVEMSISTGHAVITLTELDPNTFQPVFVVEGHRLDPATGESAGDQPFAPRREFTDPDEWRTAVSALRQTALNLPN